MSVPLAKRGVFSIFTVGILSSLAKIYRCLTLYKYTAKKQSVSQFSKRIYPLDGWDRTFLFQNKRKDIFRRKNYHLSYAKLSDVYPKVPTSSVS